MAVSQYLEHLGIQIASGLVINTSHINKFGYNPGLSTQYETVHDEGGIYSYIQTPGPATVTGASDAGAVVSIQGLDENYNLLTESVTVGGTSINSFKRIFRAKVESVVSGSVNSGDITVTVDGEARATILDGNGQTLMALYTIPRRHTGYLVKFTGSIEKAQEIIFKIYTRVDGNGVYNLKGQFGSFGSPIIYDYPIPLKLKEKTDIEIQAKAGANAAGGAIFDLILVRN